MPSLLVFVFILEVEATAISLATCLGFDATGAPLKRYPMSTCENLHPTPGGYDFGVTV